MNCNDWDAIARRYSIPSGIAYLNNGSFGPVPTAAIEASVSLFRDLESNPQEYLAAYRERTPEVKADLGDFLGMRGDDFVFVTNVTVAMNMIARGLRSLAAGDEILLTDQEYGAVDKTWQFVAARRGAHVVRARLPAPARTPAELYDAVVSAIGPRTRIVSISHITSPTGVILPVQAICAEARRRGVLTAVDGAHAPGMIPLDVESLGADFYAGNCHKWLGAPKGVGFLWVSPQSQSLLDPLIVGWGWDPENESFPGNFENPGTHNPALYLAVEQCLELQREIGPEIIAARGRELASYARERVLGIRGAQPRTPSTADLSNSLQAFDLPALPDKDLGAMMRERRIIVVVAPGGATDGEGIRLRVSTHVHNNREHIDRMVEVLREAYAD